MYDVTSLLMHSDDVPPAVKASLEAARRSPEESEEHLRSAARGLFYGTPLECDEARELVGLPPGSCG
jgi:hypothetical protein